VVMQPAVDVTSSIAISSNDLIFQYVAYDSVLYILDLIWFLRSLWLRVGYLKLHHLLFYRHLKCQNLPQLQTYLRLQCNSSLYPLPRLTS
jgi:hypothetical protein